jgi:hypothetical protein
MDISYSDLLIKENLSNHKYQSEYETFLKQFPNIPYKTLHNQIDNLTAHNFMPQFTVQQYYIQEKTNKLFKLTKNINYWKEFDDAESKEILLSGMAFSNYSIENKSIKYDFVNHVKIC